MTDRRDRFQAPLVLHGRVVAGAGGGPDKTILRYGRHLDARRYRTGAVYLHPHGDGGAAIIREQARQWHCPLWQIPERGPIDPAAIWKLARLVRELRPAIWHGHDYKSDVLGLLLRRFWPMKLISTVHGFTRETRRTRLYYHLDNRALRGYDRLIAVSPPLVEHCLQQGIARERLHYVPNAIDADEWQPRRSREQAKCELGIDPQRLVIGVVGRFSPEKGVDRAVRCFAQLRQAGHDCELHLVGDGPTRQALEALVRQLGVAGDVRFPGWQQRLQPCYEAMDMLLLPSHTEGLPNAVLEAMAMGVAVAATDVGGVSDLLDAGRCGVLLSPQVDGWADRIAARLTDATSRGRLAQAAQQRVREHFSFTRRIERITAIYDDILAAEAAGEPAAA